MEIGKEHDKQIIEPVSNPVPQKPGSPNTKPVKEPANPRKEPVKAS